MSGIPHQLSSLKVHTIEQWGESNPKHLSYVSYTHRLFVQVLGKTLAGGERGGKRGGYINSCTSSPKGLSRASVVCPLTALANKMETTALLMQIPFFMTYCSKHVFQ